MARVLGQEEENLQAALAYAERGIPVLPLHHPVVRPPVAPGARAPVACSCGNPACRSIGKHPLAERGLEAATTDPDRLTWWWRRFPLANVGLGTGVAFDVLDVDSSQAANSLRWFTVAYVAKGRGPLARTGGDGWHFYLAPTGLGNLHPRGLGRMAWRGRGGYVVAPPSRHASGAVYTWVRDLDTPLPEAPLPLRDRLRPAAPLPRRARPGPAVSPYGQDVLERWLAEVASAPRGERNCTLYRAGLRLYSLVAGGLLDREQVEEGLMVAAEASRLAVEEPAQTRKTLALAERVGSALPAGAPRQRGEPVLHAAGRASRAAGEDWAVSERHPSHPSFTPAGERERHG